jgi:hypothetical protein
MKNVSARQAVWFRPVRRREVWTAVIWPMGGARWCARLWASQPAAATSLPAAGWLSLNKRTKTCRSGWGRASVAVGGAPGVPGPLATRLLAAAQLTRCSAKILYRKLETYNPRNGTARPQSQYLWSYSHVSVCDLCIYSHYRSAYSAAGK